MVSGGMQLLPQNACCRERSLDRCSAHLFRLPGELGLVGQLGGGGLSVLTWPGQRIASEFLTSVATTILYHSQGANGAAKINRAGSAGQEIVSVRSTGQTIRFFSTCEFPSRGNLIRPMNQVVVGFSGERRFIYEDIYPNHLWAADWRFSSVG